MSCCNGRRSHSPARALAALAVPAAHPQPRGSDAQERLRYLGKADLVLKGSFSDRIYRIGPARRLLDADPLDAPTLLRSGLFARA